MNMTIPVRKLVLTAHVTSSVGWFGAVSTFLVLAVAGLRSQNPELVRATYLTMELVGWFVIVPLSLASLPSGLLMSLGTEWGLFRHYWIVAKLLITVFATVLLLLHMQPVGHLARVVAERTLIAGELAGLRIQLVADAGAAVVALLLATALSFYKPRGLTPYGRRLLGKSGMNMASTRIAAGGTASWLKLLVLAIAMLIVTFIVLHLTGRGLGGH